MHAIEEMLDSGILKNDIVNGRVKLHVHVR